MALAVVTGGDGGGPGRDLGDRGSGLGGDLAGGGSCVADGVGSTVLSRGAVRVGGATDLDGSAVDADVVGTADLTRGTVRVDHAAVFGRGGAG